MSLSEVLVASALFLGCLAGTLQLWGAAAAEGVAEERRQGLRERVEAELMASEARLRAGSRALSPAADCAAHGRALLPALETPPAPAGLRRRVAALEQGTLLEVTIEADGLHGPRRRLFSPAALGLCPAPDASSAPVPPGASR